MEKPYYNVILDDFFKILELSPSASFEDIKRKYHSLAFKYHPDLNENTEEKMKEINEAYSILKNNESRIKYVKKYGVYTTSTYLNGKTYHQEELERIKQSIVQIKKIYQKKKQLLKERFNKNYNNLEEDDYYEPIVEKGIRITYALGLEIMYQLKKLKKQADDNIFKYTVRNRKTLAGIMIAAALFTTAGINVDAENEIVPNTETKSETTSSSKLLIDEKVVMRTYKPKKDDTIESISEMFNVSVEKIISTNNIKYNLKEKSVLKIPYYISSDKLEEYTTTVNYNDFDSLEDIADLFNTDLRTLFSLNIKSFEYIDEKYTLKTDIIIVPDFEKICNLETQKTYKKQ